MAKYLTIAPDSYRDPSGVSKTGIFYNGYLAANSFALTYSQVTTSYETSTPAYLATANTLLTLGFPYVPITFICLEDKI